ncbi:hypothetical protein E2P71_08030, partial [Candidatus Bathyarchaeota archaeon]
MALEARHLDQVHSQPSGYWPVAASGLEGSRKPHPSHTTAQGSPVDVEVGDLRSRGGEHLKTTIVSLTEDTIRFLVEGVDTAFTNALRRTMVSEVPTMTIEDIFYFDNSSLVPDEILANRIGFTPLKTDLDSYVLPEECDCQAELGCPKCRAVLTMDVESTGDTVTVYSGDLVADDPNIAP